MVLLGIERLSRQYTEYLTASFGEVDLFPLDQSNFQIRI